MSTKNANKKEQGPLKRSPNPDLFRLIFLHAFFFLSMKKKVTQSCTPFFPYTSPKLQPILQFENPPNFYLAFI